MPDLDFLLDQQKVPPTSYWVWATVTATSPLQIRLDGDSSPLLGSPVSLVNPLHLSVGKRVRVEMAPTTAGRQAIIHGPSNLETDTDWVTSGVVTSVTGVTVTSQFWCRVGRTVHLDLAMTATVATTVPASGDIGNTIYRVQLATAWAPTTSGPAQALPGGQAGRAITGYIASGGLISIAAVAGTTNIAVGDTLRLGGSYLLG